MKSQELKNHLKKLERRLLTIYSVGLLMMFGLSLVSNFLMKDQAARQATSMIQRTVAIDFRETVMTLNDAELDYFKAVIYFNQQGQRLFSLPANLDPEIFQKPTLFETMVNARIEKILYFDHDQTKKVGSVLFIFNRFSHVHWAFLIWLSFLLATLPLIRYSRNWITENYKKDVLFREESTRAALAQRVRHDIRSPLGALKVATRDLQNMTDRQKKIIKRATTRIDEIVSELELIRSIEQYSQAPTTVPTQNQNASLLSALQEIIQEKRTWLAAKDMDQKIKPVIVPNFSKDAFFLFSELNLPNFKRTISNLIENAIEACTESGRVEVRMFKSEGQNIIEIIDNGIGIPHELLTRVFEKGFTTGKKNGTGLGLFYAKRDIEAVGGHLEIESQMALGTTVRIGLPSIQPPIWFRDHLTIPEGTTVVILDDQEAIRLTLAERIEQATKCKIIMFATASELIQWHSERRCNLDKVIYLLDYDLGSDKMNGVQIARDLGISTQASLITGHFDSSEIQTLCSVNGLGIIPKPYISDLTIQT